MKRLRPLLVSVLLVATGAVVVSTAPTAVAQPAPATVTFTTPGQNVYTVPAGVTRVDVVAVGGEGSASASQQGGRAGRIRGTLDVTPGQQLHAVVGTGASGPTPGANGGAAAGGPGGVCVGTPGAGGGATDVRTVGLGDPGSDGSRVVVAGGGGGAASLGTSGGDPQFFYGGHRGGGGGQSTGGVGGGGGGGGSAGQGAAGGQTAGTATAGGRGGVGVAGQGSGCGGGGGGFGGGGGGAAGTAGNGGGGGGGGGSLVPGGFPAGLAGRGETPSVTFSVSTLPVPAGPLQITSIQTFKQNDQGGGGATFTNCPSSCIWIDGPPSRRGANDRSKDFGYASTQGWGAAALQVPDFTQSFVTVRPGPDGSPADIGAPFLLSTFAHYNIPIRGDSPTAIALQTGLTVQPPAGPAAVFNLRGDNSVRLEFIETDNTPPCDPSIQRSATPCDDRFALGTPTNTTTVAGGVTWRFELLGWRTPAGAFETTFVTEERQVAQRDIYAQVTVDTNPTASTLTVDDTVPAAPVLTLTTTPVPQTGGTVTFTEGGTAIAGCADVPVDATDGVTTCTPVAPSVESARTFGGSFNGGIGYAASTAAPVTVTPPVPVDVATSTTLTGPATGTTGQPVSFVATVAPAPIGGTVTFTDGPTPVAGCTAVPVALGSATCSTSTLGTGPHTLTAAYSGTIGFAPSTSAPLTHTVSGPPPGPDPLAVCSPGAPVPAGYRVIRGTERADRLVGTAGNDIVYAGGGNDQIATLGGDDIVCAGAGDDSVAAGAGNDVVFGGDGNDSLAGENGDDVLYGEAGADRLLGGNGTDRGIDPDRGTLRIGIERTD